MFPLKQAEFLILLHFEIMQQTQRLLCKLFISQLQIAFKITFKSMHIISKEMSKRSQLFVKILLSFLAQLFILQIFLITSCIAILFFDPGETHCIQLSYLFRLLQSGTILLPFVFHDISILKSIGQFFCKMPLNLGLSDASHCHRLWLSILGRCLKT